ncbi:MliC family protein [Leptolyngbyaceae cyanobacterium UHCC 1019]
MTIQFMIPSRIILAVWAMTPLLTMPAIAQQANPTPKIITTAAYQCDDAKGFSAKFFDNQTVQATFGSKVIVIPQVESASGAQYSNGSVTILTKGDEATVEVGGTPQFTNCVAVAGLIRGLW